MKLSRTVRIAGSCASDRTKSTSGWHVGRQPEPSSRDMDGAIIGVNEGAKILHREVEDRTRRCVNDLANWLEDIISLDSSSAQSFYGEANAV